MKKQNIPTPPPTPQPEILKTKIFLNQKQQYEGASQKIVIDVKSKAPVEVVANKPVITISTPNEKSPGGKKQKNKNSNEKKIKREISLVLEATPKKCSKPLQK